TKDETSSILRKFITEIENLKDLRVKIIRCDNEGEFRNKELKDFCLQKGIKREFSNARTPQQNGVAEKRNRVLVNKTHNKTPYELFNGRTPAIGFLKPFGCHVMILNTLDNLGKFEAKGDEGYFLRYSMSSKAFRIFNKRTKRVEENVHIEFLENKAIKKGSCLNWLFDIDSLTKSMNHVPVVDAVETPIPTVSSLVPTICFTNSQEPSSKTRLISKRVTNQEETPSLDNILTLTNQFEDILGVTSNSKESNRVEADGKDGTGKDVDLHLFRSMIGSLMYLTASRPDIMFVVCACARHQVTPKECPLHVVKRIFRYLKGHPKLGLWYPKDSPFDLVAFSDSDYGGATQDRKSTSGGCRFLGRRLILWQCKKQTIVATSTTKAEYVTAASCCGQVLWIQNQLLDYGLRMSCETMSKEISTSILRL
nr:uncharacterized mitochondrial protein AtMg00810-like [Tanacetum cinerariifolium]